MTESEMNQIIERHNGNVAKVISYLQNNSNMPLWVKSALDSIQNEYDQKVRDTHQDYFNIIKKDAIKTIKLLSKEISLPLHPIQTPETSVVERSNDQPITSKLNIFISYAHQDEAFKEALDKHLSTLKRSEKIAIWNDRAILAGQEWDAEIKSQLEQAHLILLLISANFIASNYIWNEELTRAMERHERREAQIVPIFIKACDWQDAPFARIQGLPRDGKPVGSPDNDPALTDIAKGIRALMDRLEGR